MTGIVFANTVRTSWKQILYWGLGLGVLGFYIGFIASSSDIIQGYADLLASMPPALLQAFGASSIDVLRTSEGWIVSVFVAEAGIFLSVFAVMAGMNITANDEQSGVMDVIMSLPISRSAYLLERWVGYAAIGLGILLLCTAITLFSLVLFGVDARMDLLFISILNLYPGALLVMTVTGLLALIARRRALAIGLSAAFVAASYVFNVIGGAASGAIADLMQGLSFFSYTQGEAIVLGNFDPANTLLLLLVVLAGFALSVRMFISRDLGV